MNEPKTSDLVKNLNIFPQFKHTLIATSDKDQWRNLDYSQYRQLKETATKSQMLVTAHQTGVLLIADTPLEIAYDAFKTSSPAIQEVKRRAGILTVRPEPVLITGESGTGKELVAKILHGNRTGKFVAINVTSLAETLFESELFGHEKGSFTGANSERKGRIESAENGTLFIDEVGEMPMNIQVKLLRVLQEGVYQRVGSDIDRPVKCRFVFATHCSLPEMVEKKLFRLDFYMRIAIYQLHLTPLRERKEDIMLLATTYGIPAGEVTSFITALDQETNNLRGNCRELQSMIANWVLFGTIR